MAVRILDPDSAMSMSELTPSQRLALQFRRELDSRLVPGSERSLARKIPRKPIS